VAQLTHLVVVKIDDVLVVPPLLANKERVVGPVAVKCLGAVEYLAAISLAITRRALHTSRELFRPSLLGAVNPVKEIAQQVRLTLEHVVLVILVQDAGPVGTTRVVPGAKSNHLSGAILQ
jgi:hypothetical protein